MNIVWVVTIFGLQSFIFGGCGSESEVNYLADRKWSIYYEFLKTASLERQNGECTNQLNEILNAINRGEVWALKALDASGSVSSSFIYQNNFWHGSKLACKLLNSKITPWMSSRFNGKIANEIPPFKMQYFTVFANYSTSNQLPQLLYAYVPFQLGVCAPESCTKGQVLNAMKPLLEYGQLPFQQLYNVTFNVFMIRTENLMNFFTREYVIISCLMGYLVLVLLMNFLETDKKTIWGRFISCFNVRRNYQDLMTTTKLDGNIECLDGMRSIACIWGIIGHLYLFSTFVYENATEVMYMAGNFGFFFVVFFVAPLIESFFVISAFLLTYNFLNNERQKEEIIGNGLMKNVVLYLKQWLNRYIRLTPGLLVTIALTRLVAVYMEEATSLYVPGTMGNNCLTNSWWRNLLYIQSFYSVDELCISVSWFLSCEMCYYSATLLGLFIFAKSPSAGKVCFFLLMGSSMVYSFLVNYLEQFEYGFDMLRQTADTLYISPLVRANSFLAGIIGGYFLYSSKDLPSKLNDRLKLIWAALEILGFTLYFLILSFFKSLPMIFLQFVNAIGRFIIGCLIMGTIIVRSSNNTGIMNSLLRAKFFTHFSKLTYMLYLLNPVVIYAYRAASDSTLRLNISNIIIEGLGVVVVCYFGAFLTSMLFERPYFRLCSEFLMKQKRSSYTNNLVNEQNDKIKSN